MRREIQSATENRDTLAVNDRTTLASPDVVAGYVKVAGSFCVDQGLPLSASE